MEGENFVNLKGSLQWGEVKQVGQNNTSLYKAKLKIPIEDRDSYIKVAAWRDTADALAALPKDAFIHIHGHIEESSYDGKCKSCGSAEKKYWTEVVIDNFIQLA